MDDGSLIESVVHSSKIYSGQLFNLRKDMVRLPNGRLVYRDVVEHCGAVAIIPIIDEKVILIRQFRQATSKVLYEFPAGTLIKGETPDMCATRELKEETGYLSGTLKALFHCYLAPGYSTEIIHFFLATDLEQVERETEPDEFIEILPVTMNKALQMVMSNEIEDAKTICGLLFLQQLHSRKSVTKRS